MKSPIRVDIKHENLKKLNALQQQKQKETGKTPSLGVVLDEVLDELPTAPTGTVVLSYQ